MDHATLTQIDARETDHTRPVADAAANTLANAVAGSHLTQSERSFVDCRQRLISYLVKLNHALDEDLQDLAHAILTRFCDSLVDYLSAGHFQLFQRLVPGPHEYAAIESTTHAAMTFTDAWDGRQVPDVAHLKADLEQLALVLGTRFELEDDILCGQG